MCWCLPAEAGAWKIYGGFNDEGLARAIAASKIPVVSAVGHEVDYTIADFVADLRAPTPSVAAEMLLPEKKELIFGIHEHKKRMGRALRDTLDAARQRLDDLVNRRAFREPQRFLREKNHELQELERGLRIFAVRALDLSKERLKSAAGRLQALNPLGCLARGYSMTYEPRTSRLVKSVKGISSGDVILSRLSDGTLLSRVEQVSPMDDDKTKADDG